MCLNTDDMAVIGNHITDEYAFIITHFDVTKMQIMDLLYNAVEGAFASEKTKEYLRHELDLL